MEQSPSWGANRFSSNQEIRCILWNQKVRYRIHKCFLFEWFVTWRVFTSTSPNPQVGGPPLVGCPQRIVKYIRSYPPYWRPFLHPQPEDAPCRGDRDPLIMGSVCISQWNHWEMRGQADDKEVKRLEKKRTNFIKKLRTGPLSLKPPPPFTIERGHKMAIPNFTWFFKYNGVTYFLLFLTSWAVPALGSRFPIPIAVCMCVSYSVRLFALRWDAPLCVSSTKCSLSSHSCQKHIGRLKCSRLKEFQRSRYNERNSKLNL